MQRILNIKGKAIEIVLLGLVAIVVFAEGIRFVTTMSHSIGAVEAGTYLLVLAGLLAALLCVYALKTETKVPVPRAEEGAETDRGGTDIRDALIGIALFLALSVMLHYVDYAIATFLFFTAYLRIFGRYRWPVIVLIAASVGLGSAYLWNVLGVPMPNSDIFTF